jgi:hypothetical protein
MKGNYSRQGTATFISVKKKATTYNMHVKMMPNYKKNPSLSAQILIN